MCGVNTVTCEMAKNLVLPGIGRILLADTERVTKANLLSNFFYSPTAATEGKTRAEAAYHLLSELNPV